MEPTKVSKLSVPLDVLSHDEEDKKTNDNKDNITQIPSTSENSKISEINDTFTTADTTSTTSSSSSSPPPPPTTKKVFFPQLEGLRAVMSIWVVCYHVFWHTAFFSPDESTFLTMFFKDTFFHRLVSTGYNAVDVFFILSGFFTVLPYLKNPLDITPPKVVSWRQFMYGKLLRIYPSMILTLFIVCVVFTNFDTNAIIPWDYIPTMGIQDLAKQANIISDGPDSSCAYFVSNLLMMNNFAPLCGCIAWTWTLAFQAQFYAIFPLVLRFINIKTNYMIIFIIIAILATILRYITFVSLFEHTLPFPVFLFNADQIIASFSFTHFWYASYHTRLLTLFFGVALGVIYKQYTYVGTFLHKYPIVMYILHMIGLPAIVWNHYSSIFSSPAIENTFVTAGGIYWLSGLCFILYDMIENITIIGKGLSYILSFSFWNFFAKYSFGVYMIHTVISMKLWKLYAQYIDVIFPLTFTKYFTVLLLCFFFSIIYSIVFEKLIDMIVIQIKKYIGPWIHRKAQVDVDVVVVDEEKKSN